MAENPRDRLVKLRRLKELRDKASGAVSATPGASSPRNPFSQGTGLPSPDDMRAATAGAAIKSRDDTADRLDAERTPGSTAPKNPYSLGTGLPSPEDMRQWEEATRPARRVTEWQDREAQSTDPKRAGFNPSVQPDPEDGIYPTPTEEVGRHMIQAVEAPVEGVSEPVRRYLDEMRAGGSTDKAAGAFMDASMGLVAAPFVAGTAPFSSMLGEAKEEGAEVNPALEALHKPIEWMGEGGEYVREQVGKTGARLYNDILRENEMRDPMKMPGWWLGLTDEPTVPTNEEVNSTEWSFLGSAASAASYGVMAIPHAVGPRARAGFARAGQNPLTARFPEFIQRAAADAVPLPESSVGHMPWDFARQGEMSPGRPPTVPRAAPDPGIPAPSRKAQMSAQSKIVGETMESSLKGADRVMAEKRRGEQMGPRAPRQFDRVPEFDAEVAGVRPPPKPQLPIADVPAAKPVEPLSPPPKSAALPEPARAPEPVIEPRVGEFVSRTDRFATEMESLAATLEDAVYQRDAARQAGREAKASRIGGEVERLGEPVRDLLKKAQREGADIDALLDGIDLPAAEKARLDPRVASPKVIEGKAEAAVPAKPTADPGIEYRHSMPLDAMWDGTKRVAKAGESVYDGVDAALAERISKPIARTIRATMQSTKGGRKVADAMRKAFQDPLKQISEEFSTEAVRGRGSKELANIDGAQAGNRLRDALKTLTEPEREATYRYMNSEADALPAHFTDQQRAVIQNTVAEIQSLGRELVERGLNSAEAVEQFQRYLPRLYEDSMKSRGALRASRKFRTEEQYTRSDKYLTRMDVSDVPFDVFQAMAKDSGGFAVTRKGKSVQAKFETREARETFIGKLKTERRAAILDDLSIPYRRTKDGALRPNFRNVKASVRDAYQRRVGGDSVISGRKVGREAPMPAELRELVGEITDPSVAAARAIQSAKSRIATHEFFKRVEKGGDSKGAWTFESEALAPDGAILLSEKWAGPLKGKWVREDVATWLKETHDVGTGMGDLGRAWTAQWKANKTILSPRTAMRQAYSMPQQLHMAGVNALNPNNWGTFKEAVRALSGDHPLYREMIQNEIIRGALPTHEMKILETIMDRKDLSPGAKWGQILANPVMAFEKGRAVQSKMGNYYNKPDALVRASVFLDRINKGMSVKEAVIEVNRYTNNYASVGKAVQWASMSPIVSPFIRFKAETFRNFLNTLEHHPLRAIGALFHTKAARAILGWTLLDEMTDDDWEALDNERGGLEIPTGIDDEGKVWSFDMNFVDIMGDIFPDPVKVGDERLRPFLVELLGLSEAPGIELIGAINDSFQGRDIEDSRGRVYAREGQDTLDRVGGFAEFYGKSTLPTWTPGIGWHSRAVTAAAKGEKPSPHAPMQDLKFALISALFGLNFRQFDPDRELDKLDYQAKKKVGALRAQERAGGNADASYKRLDEDLDKREGALLRSRSSR